eukprot:15470832-Alexandrium_andersonii.AAC.1
MGAAAQESAPVMPGGTSFTEKLGDPGCAQWRPFPTGPGGTPAVHNLPDGMRPCALLGAVACRRRL